MPENESSFVLPRRELSQIREDNWPFKYSVHPVRGLLKNVAPVLLAPPEQPAKPKKRGRGWAGRHAAWAKAKKKIP